MAFEARFFKESMLVMHEEISHEKLWPLIQMLGYQRPILGSECSPSELAGLGKELFNFKNFFNEQSYLNDVTQGG